ncbi:MULTISPECIES: hypothetical protein [unclassified Methylotenera]|jgi:hypothetical protein|uniref:hypothetical protein n=1 Tax=unclassified Methylotenera TaxID=2643294 RepID=UPI00035E6FA2|nr:MULTISPECIES: hypothetical protein [unclassified Methylotenera]
MLKFAHMMNKKSVNGSIVELALEFPSEPQLAPKKGDPVHIKLPENDVDGVIASVIGQDLLIDVEGLISYWVFNKAEALSATKGFKHTYSVL